MVEVTVYGPGCARCAATAQMIETAAAKAGVPVQVSKVTDLRAIAAAGVMATPGVAVNGRLVHAGGLPDAARIPGWLGAG